MPDICINQRNIAALTTVRPFGENLANWRFRRCPYQRGLYTILMKHDGAAAVMDAAVLIGTTEVVQRGPVTNGGADGTMPTPAGANSAPAHQFYAEYGDEIVLELYEVGNVATTDVAIWANVEPA